MMVVMIGKTLVLLTMISMVVGVVEFHEMEGREIRPDHFVAVFHSHFNPTQRMYHLKRHQSLIDADPSSEIKHTFTIGTFSGYTGKLSPKLLSRVMNDSVSLSYIQRETVVTINAPTEQRVNPSPFVHLDPNLDDSRSFVDINAHHNQPHISKMRWTNSSASSSCYEQNSAVWGLVRTSQRSKLLNGNYYFDSLGEGVDAYVIDTGVYAGHSQFGGRAKFGVSFTGEDHESDQNGHGTHCAGTIGAETYGIAKGVNIIGVQVLSSTGNGYMSWVIKGIEWTCDAYKSSSNKCVVNLSLGGGYYKALNQAVNELVKCGCTVVVAAGNEGADACYTSPASSENAISVGASSNQDARAYFSNYGKCVDLFAPGVSITSTWIGSDKSINTLSGTSMAAPHVTGIAAKLVASTGYTGQDINSKILEAASSGYLYSSSLGADSPNLLAYDAC